MSRVIKFRAWDVEAKQMIEIGEPAGIEWARGHGAKLVFGETFHDDFIDGGIINYELMQFMGLKDKDGNDIYEGDIVRDARWDQQFEVKWCDGKREFLRGQLGWILDDSKFSPIGHIEELTAHLENTELDREAYFNGVVVGNIYETPE